MNTPITDAAVASDESVLWEGEIWIDPEVARRLETDRAALMEIVQSYVENGHSLALMQRAVSALTAARANFSQP